MNITEFEDELLTSFKNFINTMKSHAEVGKREDLTYADWFDTFRAYEEVGNDMEFQYHGKRVLDVNGPVCQLCASSLEAQSEEERIRATLRWCSSVEKTFSPRIDVPKDEGSMISEKFLAAAIQHIRQLTCLLKVEE